MASLQHSNAAPWLLLALATLLAGGAAAQTTVPPCSRETAWSTLCPMTGRSYVCLAGISKGGCDPTKAFSPFACSQQVRHILCSLQRRLRHARSTQATTDRRSSLFTAAAVRPLLLPSLAIAVFLRPSQPVVPARRRVHGRAALLPLRHHVPRLPELHGLQGRAAPGRLHPAVRQPGAPRARTMRPAPPTALGSQGSIVVPSFCGAVRPNTGAAAPTPAAAVPSISSSTAQRPQPASSHRRHLTSSS